MKIKARISGVARIALALPADASVENQARTRGGFAGADKSTNGIRVSFQIAHCSVDGMSLPRFAISKVPLPLICMCVGPEPDVNESQD